MRVPELPEVEALALDLRSRLHDRAITKIHLVTKARVPDADKDKFEELANKAKEGCPISRLLKAAEITLDAQLI